MPHWLDFKTARIHLALVLLAMAVMATAWAAPPALLYSDLISGPAIGGEGGNGVFVCVFGSNFTEQGAISVGGVTAATILVWTDPGEPYVAGHYAQACFQVAANTPRGEQSIILGNGNGTSNALPFTVRAGRIYFVALTGSDTVGTGADDQPWATTAYAIAHMSAGDTTYIEDGVVESKIQGTSNAVVNVNKSGTPGNPIMVGAYPGATITAVANSGYRALSNWFNSTTPVSYWGAFGWTLMAEGVTPNSAVSLKPGEEIRLINNDISCTGQGCDGQSAGLVSDHVTGVTVVGNHFHDVGCHEDLPGYTATVHPCKWITPTTTIATTGTTMTATAFTSGFAVGDVIQVNAVMRQVIAIKSNYVYTLDAAFPSDLAPGTKWQYRDFVPNKQFHNVYFSTDTNDVWFAYNEIDGSEGHAFRGLQTHSSRGSAQHGIHVHNNYIHDTYGDCINLATVDPSQGAVEAYKNTLENCGIEEWWYPPGGYGGTACIASGNNDLGAAGYGSGTVEVFNNSCVGYGENRKAGTGAGGTNTAQGGVFMGSQEPGLRMRLANNSFVATAPTQNYTAVATNHALVCQADTQDARCSGESRSNLWHGSAQPPPKLANNMTIATKLQQCEKKPAPPRRRVGGAVD